MNLQTTCINFRNHFLKNLELEMDFYSLVSSDIALSLLSVTIPLLDHLNWPVRGLTAGENVTIKSYTENVTEGK